MNAPIRVLLADDHMLVRRGISTMLLSFSDLVVVGEAQTGVETLELCDTVRPDVVLLDLLLPATDSAELTHAIRTRHPQIQVIVLTNWSEYGLVQRALAAGAEGYLLKDSNIDDLAKAIRQSDPVQMQKPAQSLPAVDLTSREMEILGLMERGLTNGQIAAQLEISRATVKYHVSGILSKLGVSSRTEAVARAIQSNLTNGHH